jgi:hypothetical protein
MEIIKIIEIRVPIKIIRIMKISVPKSSAIKITAYCDFYRADLGER